MSVKEYLRSVLKEQARDHTFPSGTKPNFISKPHLCKENDRVMSWSWRLYKCCFTWNKVAWYSLRFSVQSNIWKYNEKSKSGKNNIFVVKQIWQFCYLSCDWVPVFFLKRWLEIWNEYATGCFFKYLRILESSYKQSHFQLYSRNWLMFFIIIVIPYLIT